MPKFPLIGPSYTSQSVNADCQTTMNLYPEQIESGAGNNQIVLYPAPGTKEFVDLTPIVPPPSGPCPTPFATPLGHLTGIVVEDTLSTTITVAGSLVPVHTGDTMFLALYTIPTGTPVTDIDIISIVDQTYGAIWSQLGATQTFQVGGSPDPSNTANFQLFTAIAPVDFFGNVNLLITYNGTSHNHGTFGQFVYVNLGAFQVVNGDTETGSNPTGPPVTGSASKNFIISFFSPAEVNSIHAASPFFTLTTGSVSAAVYHDPVSGFYAGDAGTYTPQWNAGVSVVAAVINAVYAAEGGCGSPPPTLLQPEIVGAGEYNWDLAGGTIVGGTRINVPVITGPIQPGDILFLLFNVTVGPGQPYNPITTITAPMMLAGNFTQLGAAYYDLGALAIPNEFRFFQVFYAIAQNSVAATTLLINLTPGANDMGGSIMLVRNILALDQLSSTIVATPSVAAPPIVAPAPRFVFSFFASNEALTTPHPDSTIYHFFTGGTSGMAGIVSFFTLDPMLGTLYTAPPGTYSPTWAKIADGFLAAALNVSFSIKPA
jgi:hypothetical protein